MSKKIKSFLTIIAIAFLSFSVFLGIGYFYLENNLKQEVKQETPSVPYYSEEPENVGIVVEISGWKNFFYLDFYNKRLSIVFGVDLSDVDTQILGYSIDHYIEADYSLLEGIIDIVGGIEVETDGEILRFTGVQITDMLSTTESREESEKEIILKIVEKISKNGFHKEDFLYIIENSDTTLTVPICYFWSDYMKDICESVNLVN
jgi:hypothetical protein